MASTQQKVHEIIQTASIACAEADGDFGQMPGADSSAIIPIQTAMIIEIASAHGIEFTNSAAADLLLAFTETMQSNQVLVSRQAISGWLPGIENMSNDSTAAALTEAIGWAVNGHFEQAVAKGKFTSQ